METMKDIIAAHLRPLIDMAFPLSKGVEKLQTICPLHAYCPSIWAAGRQGTLHPPSMPIGTFVVPLQELAIERVQQLVKITSEVSAHVMIDLQCQVS
jgi:hypothetical protein